MNAVTQSCTTLVRSTYNVAHLGLDMALWSRGWAAEYRTPAFRALSLVQTHKARTEHTEHHRRVGFNDFIVDAAAGWLRLAASLVTRSMYSYS